MQWKAKARSAFDQSSFTTHVDIKDSSAVLKKAIFGLSFDDIAIMITDCGSDVEKSAQVVGTIQVPCLAYIVNLIAKKLIYEIEPEEDEVDDDNPSDSDFEEECVLRKLTQCVKLVHRL